MENFWRAVVGILFFVCFLGFPIIGFSSGYYFGPWGYLAFPLCFCFIMWASMWNEIMENRKSDRTWSMHMQAIAGGFVGGPLVCLGLMAIMWVIAGIVEGQTEYSMRQAYCERHANSQYEYRQCIRDH